jgi:hypothetical protein
MTKRKHTPYKEPKHITQAQIDAVIRVMHDQSTRTYVTKPDPQDLAREVLEAAWTADQAAAPHPKPYEGDVEEDNDGA